MKAKCLYNNLKSLSDAKVVQRLNDYIHLDDGDSDLDVGKEYEVQAVEFRGGGLWLYLHTVESNDYPYPYPIEFFEIVNNSLPAQWHILFGVEADNSIIKRISFREWVEDNYFYEKLIDGNSDTVFIYLSNKQ